MVSKVMIELEPQTKCKVEVNLGSHPLLLWFTFLAVRGEGSDLHTKVIFDRSGLELGG